MLLWSQVTETVVFTYMGMVLFTGEFTSWEPVFIVLAILFCLIGRACNVFPLRWVIVQSPPPTPPLTLACSRACVFSASSSRCAGCVVNQYAGEFAPQATHSPKDDACHLVCGYVFSFHGLALWQPAQFVCVCVFVFLVLFCV